MKLQRLAATIVTLILLWAVFPDTLAADPEVLWGFSANTKIVGSPAVSADGVTYITTADGSLIAVNPDGAKRWDYHSAKLPLSPSIGPDGTIYFSSKDGFVHAVNPDGSLKWKFAATDTNSPPISDIAIAPDAAVYFTSGDGNLYRVLPSGVVDWKTNIVNSMGGPSVDNDGTIYYQTFDSRGARLLLALNPDSSLKWTNLAPSVNLYFDPVAPAVTADRIYVTDRGFFSAIDKSGQALWRTAKISTQSYATPSVGPDGTIYLGFSPGGIVNFKTNGSSNWVTTFLPSLNGSPAIAADGRIVATGYFKTAVVIAADGKSATNLTLPGVLYDYNPTDTSPAITQEGIAYVCASNVLAAVRINSPPANSGWPMYGGNPQHTWRPAITDNSISIIQNPTPQKVISQSPLTLGVAAQSGSSLSYQWYFNDTALLDQTNATCHFASTDATNAGNYYAIVSNSSISATSTVAQVIIQYSLTLNASSGGSVSAIPPGATYLPDSVISILATPIGDSIFTGWSGDISNSENPISITIQSNTVIHATFSPAVTLQASAGSGGSVAVSPLQSLYLIGSEVQFTATPSTGYAFQNWSGATNSTSNPLTLALNENTTLTANFIDVAAPTISITTPTDGSTTTNKNFSLSGAIADNGPISTTSYTLNNGPSKPLTLVTGVFNVPNLTLQVGTNVIHVAVSDSAGNTNTAQSIVVWDPPRRLSLSATNTLQEGTEFDSTLDLSSSGEIGAATFKILYDTNYITLLNLTWNDSLFSGALRVVNTNVLGEITASFSLPGNALPAGLTNIATISLRARSVPTNLVTTLAVLIDDVSSDAGDPLLEGNAGIGASLEISRRIFIGDNNANNAYDIGDATIIQRLLAGLDPVRPWDITLNDVNGSSRLDSGDLTRVIRAVVGLDPQPALPAHSPALPISKIAAKASTAPPVLALAENNAAAFSIKPSATRVAPGDTLVCTVNLNNAGSISGLSFALNYDPTLLRLTSSASYAVGPFISPNAFFLWNPSAPGSDFNLQGGLLSLAATTSQPWTGAGAVALVTFKVQPGIQSANASVTLSQGKLTVTGYNVSVLPSASFTVQGIESPSLSANAITLTETQIQFKFPIDSGLTCHVESTADFATWTDLGLATIVNGQAQLTIPRPLTNQFFRLKILSGN